MGGAPKNGSHGGKFLDFGRHYFRPKGPGGGGKFFYSVDFFYSVEIFFIAPNFLFIASKFFYRHLL